MTVVIVDYGSGNLHSAAKAFERAARESGNDERIVVTGDPEEVLRADRVVLPGVGAFADCRRGLDAVAGMVQALNTRVRRQGRPFLGICVGMQLMAERGREYEVTPGLGWIAGEVDRRKENHGFHIRKLAMSLSPRRWLFSGWNWVPTTLSRPTIAVTGPP